MRRTMTRVQAWSRVSSSRARTPRRARGCRVSSGCRPIGGSSAPRSIAGTARSSSGPSARPVSATRIGWNSALPFCPVLALTWFADRAEPLAIEPRRRRSSSASAATTARAPSRAASRAELRIAQRRVGVVVEQKRQPRRNLVEPIDRRARHRHRRGEELEAASVGRHLRPRFMKYGSDSSARRSRIGHLQVVPVHPGQLLLVEDAGAVAHVARARIAARARRSAAARRPPPGDQPMSAR